MTSKIDHLPDHSRVWIYQAPRPLTVEEREVIAAEMENFTADWHAHGKPLRSGYALLHRRFLILAVDETGQAATGCSIDDSMAAVRQLVQDLDVDLFDRMQVAFRSENNLVVSVPLTEFRKMIEEGDITPDTLVYNNLVSTLGEFRTQWEVPAGKSWHARYFAKVG